MMRNLRRFSAWGALLLLASGCSWFTWLPWVDDDSGAEALEPAKLVKFDPEARIGREWRGKVGDGLGRKYLEIQPAIAADRIFAADGYGLVDAYDVFTGKRIWRARIGEIRRSFRERLDFADRRDPSFLSGGVGVAHGRVLLGTTQGEVIALSAADGSEEWRVEVGGEVLAPPVGGQNLIFVQTIDGRLIALERADGAVRWSFDNPVPVLSLRGTSSPVYGDGVVYAGFANGMVVAIRAENGEPIWQHRVMLPQGRSELERMVDVDSTPVLGGGILYVAAYQGKVKGLRAADGSLLWEHDVSSHRDLAQGYDQLYVIDDTDVITAYDQRTAQVAWTQDGLYRRGLSSPVVFGNYLVTLDSDGYLHVLSQTDGRFMARQRVDRKGVRSRPAVGSEAVYVLGNSGSLNAFDIRAR